MSLTRLLDGNANLRNFIPNLKSTVTNLQGEIHSREIWKQTIQINGVGGQGDLSHIGTAFDYVARSLLARKFKTAEIEIENKLKAAEGLIYVNEGFFKMGYLPKNPELRSVIIAFHNKLHELMPEVSSYFNVKFKQACQRREKFIRGENINLSEIIEDAMILAGLETIFRGKSFHICDKFFKEKHDISYLDCWRTVSDKEIADNIMELVNLFLSSLDGLQPRKIILNPSFGDYTRAVGGADADIIIDDMVIDFKTTTKLQYHQIDLAQVLAYAAMANALGHKINRAGLYFARWGIYIIVGINTSLPPNFLNNYLNLIMESSGPKKP